MTSHQPTAKSLFLLVLLALLTFIKADPFYWISDGLASLGLSDFLTFALQLTLLAALAVLLGVILYHYLGRGVFGWQWPSWQLLIFWFILFGVAYLTVDWLYHQQITQNGQTQQQATNEVFLGGGAYLLLLRTILISPLYEELIFRAGLMSLVFKENKFYLDVLLSSALFSLSHMIGYSWSFHDVLIYGLMGLVFSLIYRTGKSIWHSYLAHALWNTIAMWGWIAWLLHR